MPLRHLLYRCPICGADPTVGRGDAALCAGCGASFHRDRGARIRVCGPGEGEHVERVADLVDAIASRGGPLPAATREDGSIAYAAAAVLRRRVDEAAVLYGGEVTGFAERMGEGRAGVVAVTDRELRFAAEVSGARRGPDGTAAGARSGGGDGAAAPGADGEIRRWPLLDISALQTSSGALQLSLKPDELVELRFVTDSPWRWELLVEHLLREAWRGEGRGEIVEFRPRITGA